MRKESSAVWREATTEEANENRNTLRGPRATGCSTKVPLCGLVTRIKMRAMGSKVVCEEHNRLRDEAVAAVLEARRIRWNSDLSFYQDSELSHDQHRKIDALLKHLLVGHEGQPCPGGDRPIVASAPLARTAFAPRRQSIQPHDEPQSKCS
jgi:hypothetical protein